METREEKKRYLLDKTFSIISPQGDGNDNVASSASGRFKSFSIISPQGDGNMSTNPWLLEPAVELFQSFPRKGMETTVSINPFPPRCTAFSIISPQGDGNVPPEFVPSSPLRRYVFFNHFPARGWKPLYPGVLAHLASKLFQSFPRKGMETRYSLRGKPSSFTLFQSFPRKGMETGGEEF